jgi:hypothetical protein
MLLWKALMQTGYREEVPKYRGWLYMEHSLPHSEVYVDIRSRPVFLDGSCGPPGLLGMT